VAESVISLAERLKQRREELGLSQSQAARELDVARTAYRLWELEAAKPAPDRWRLIASWLGVSVTTMLLAEDLLTEDEAAQSEVVEVDFGQSGRNWDAVAAAKQGDFFSQAGALLEEGVRSGEITKGQADILRVFFDRVGTESSQAPTAAWEDAELRKSFPVDAHAPGLARDAVSVVGAGMPSDDLAVARLLVSELVTNSVLHGPKGGEVTIGLFIGVGRNRLRVEVSDGSTEGARPKEGGYGLVLVATLSTRWGAGRQDGLNVTWFELDLRSPGT
jgi:transcriptional regulator with XRE-family HTH domain/anti-sigma regulatory factor (Ser/Thr protein kinase)